MAEPSSVDNRQITVTLAENDLGQLLDGLAVLIDEWDYTYRFHAGLAAELDQVVRECSSAEEARQIRDHYQRIADDLYRQLEAERRAR